MANLQPLPDISTPQYGVCLDGVTQNVNRCVISEVSCETGAEVYSPPYESNQPCKTPSDVVIGRCASSLDDNRCGPSSISCGTKSSFYESIDSSCSLLVDSKSSNEKLFKRTTFPACWDSDAQSWQCALDEQYCLSHENLKYSKWAAEWGPDPCHCEDVPTGVCYQTTGSVDDNNLTRENSFCAISPGDCPSTYGWMSARAFLGSERATFQCRFCKDPEDKYFDSYTAGACRKENDSSPSSYTSCAMESIDCPPETKFVSSERLAKEGLRCPAELTQNWGECKSATDQVECTNKADSCLYDFRFEADGSGCNLYQNSKTGLPTYFSYCSPRTDNDDRDWRDIRCVWDKSECDLSKERWEEARLPNKAWFSGCLCEDVLTGVCKEPSTGVYHCAVSAKACTDPSSYVPQRLLKERNIDLSCPLCVSRQLHTPATPMPATSPPTIAPSRSIGLGSKPRPAIDSVSLQPTLSKPTPSPETSSFANNNKDSGKGENLSSGLIAGISVLVILIVVIVIEAPFLEKYRRGRMNQAQKPDSAVTEEVVEDATEDQKDASASIDIDHDAEFVTASVQIT